jgi:hypothetical protein
MDMALALSALDAFQLMIEQAEEELKTTGEEFGAVFEWATSIKGVGDWLAIKLLAKLDDIGRFGSISSLWKYCGLACVDGVADGGKYVRTIKATLLGPQGFADQFVRQRTFPYRDLYDQYKERKREQYPEPHCTKCGQLSPEKKSGGKSKCCGAKIAHTDGHIDNMAKRIIAKEFLKHLWLAWRKIEGLPVSEPHGEDEPLAIPNFDI